MSGLITKEGQDDLLERGYSRRQFGRVAALLGMQSAAIAAAFPHLLGAAEAREMPADRDKSGMIRIGSNECWTGPFPAGIAAGEAAVRLGNRYEPTHMRRTLIENVAAVENVPATHILPWPGSSDPLSRVIVTFCSPTRGLVTANPTYEAAWRTADWLQAKSTTVPLKAANRYAVDVRALLAADPHAGVYYICSPNNPTGTLTPIADIAWLLDNKPAGSIVLVDEAYIHFAGTQSAASLVARSKDIIVLRTFSKLFGMAGLRLGLSLAHPETHQKMMRYDGANQSGTLSIVALAAGGASVLRAQDIVARRNEMIAAREETFAFLKKRGVSFIPSQANMFMIDWKKPAAPIRQAFAAQNIDIGRSWTLWPNCSRITVGSAADMKAFCGALDKIVA
ncbi:pyridoxal phosphate-dependent aminotransferase [Nguyenibacter sp. L1]|uniref:pyridoxal phosphate-dependent aminotransferase n=1 Tax=Nguyenibacter sp. L1 TaxID=3049350 RepID=UPI002B4924BE|nr:pyridoxal phosphate-dependent aminotransferase [Nguyenibacter sp. L1]WRH86880.1 pyridoxal phosphate-dependent aminotransferase [Nguyenibacter sp. L1]